MQRWYVVQSKYRREMLLWKQLCARSIEAYFPRLYNHTGQAARLRAKPLFPGYMFVHVDLATVGRSILQWVPGALSLVSFGSEPAFVSEGIVRGIEERVSRINSAAAKPDLGLRHGDSVDIHSGPFAGYRGIFDSQLSGCERVVILLNFLRDHQTRVELPVTQIAPAKQSPT